MTTTAVLTRHAESPAPDTIARVDALLRAWTPRTDAEWRRAYVVFTCRMVRALHGHRRGNVPAAEMKRTLVRCRETFEEVNAADRIRLADLFRHRPDPARVWVQRAQEGTSGDGCWSASRKEFVP